MTTSFVTCQWHYTSDYTGLKIVNEHGDIFGFIGRSQKNWYWQRETREPRESPDLESAALDLIRTMGLSQISDAEGWAYACGMLGWKTSYIPAAIAPPKPIVAPEQVKAALLKKPRLLWGTLRALASLNVAGPWEQKPGKDRSTLHFRSHPTTFSAVVRVHVNAKGQVHVWRGNARLQGCEAPTPEEAKQKVDEELRGMGWILISEEEDP